MFFSPQGVSLVAMGFCPSNVEHLLFGAS